MARVRAPIRHITALFTLAAAAAVAVGPAAAQEAKRALEHEDTWSWNEIETRVLSHDGQFLAYVLQPFEGDPTLVVTTTDGRERFRTRGQAPRFTGDSRFVAFRIPAPVAVTDSLRLDGVSGEDLPGDTLAVAALAPDMDRELERLGPIASFEIPERGSAWIAYVRPDGEADDDGTAEEEESPSTEPTEPGVPPAEPEPTEPEPMEPEPMEPEPAEPEPTASEEEGSPEEAEEDEDPYHDKEDGQTLFVRALEDGFSSQLSLVADYAWAENGSVLGVARRSESGEDDGIQYFSTDAREWHVLVADTGHFAGVVLDREGTRLAFVSDYEDWAAERPAYALYAAETDGEGIRRVAAEGSEGMRSGWSVSEHRDPFFSDDGTRLFFGAAPRPAPDPDPVLPENKRVEVDIWNWKDPYLQPMQLVRLEDEQERSYLAVAHEGEERIVQLGRPAIEEVELADGGVGAFAVGVTDGPYRAELSWDGRYQDGFAIDLATGETTPIVTGVRGFRGVQISPGGRYAYWWDEAERDWRARALAGGETVDLTASIPHPMWDELDDHPQGPPPWAAAVWTEDDEAILVPDEYDVWRVDPGQPERPVSVTGERGRLEGVRYRVLLTDADEPAAPDGPAPFSLFDLDSRRAGYASGRTDRAEAPRELLSGPYAYGTPREAEEADLLVWTRQSFSEYPDLWVSGPDFADPVRLSEANPQQDQYRWGTAELVRWLSNDGAELDGILYKPEGFDPSRRYPMMVYFYERLADQLHTHQTPVPNRASIRYPFYTSRDYVVFVPDIPYEIGYPGESALDAVVPGVMALIEDGFIDPARIGLQGHSWGGYQIAYMITRTNLFAAAEAGAPVSNMTSAYGGIRWGSGMSRMFQYERSQSRIGGTLWNATQRYLHNSPLFYADKIETPLLMLHNDEDGAVPWYQGIELFVAMRRLDKPVFMLNYNGEAHGLTREHNRKDWAIRMQQFFDHYLKGTPAPVWMEHGVPAIDKGRTLGYELVTEEAAVTQESGGGS